jgi:5-oxoprolinase (ATP-hydrolysing)
MAAALRRLGRQHYEARELLDDGTPIAVAISVEDGFARIDFTGSGAIHPGNLNATPAIVNGAILYVLRLLLDRPLPLNEGLFDRVEIIVPEGLLSPAFSEDPAHSPAVVGGNTETSQRLVDTLLRALGIAACSQGTMNNVLFGNQSFAYYETVCGGSGATAEGPGASAVHTHMTNTRITDPEVLEVRYPVRLERFEIRRGSGGAGHHRGGDGVIREYRFLEPLSVSILSQHRVEAPYGADGGGAGARGRQWIERAGGDVLELRPVDGVEVQVDDRLILETPGGGGWGAVRA